MSINVELLGEWKGLFVHRINDSITRERFIVSTYDLSDSFIQDIASNNSDIVDTSSFLDWVSSDCMPWDEIGLLGDKAFLSFGGIESATEYREKIKIAMPISFIVETEPRWLYTVKGFMAWQLAQVRLYMENN